MSGHGLLSKHAACRKGCAGNAAPNPLCAVQLKQFQCDPEKVLNLHTCICLQPWIRVGVLKCRKRSVCVGLCRTEVPSPGADP